MALRHLNDPRGLLVCADQEIQYFPDRGISQLERANEVLSVTGAIMTSESLDLRMQFPVKVHA